MLKQKTIEEYHSNNYCQNSFWELREFKVKLLMSRYDRMVLIAVIEKGECDWPVRIAHHTGTEVNLTFECNARVIVLQDIAWQICIFDWSDLITSL